MTRRSIVLLGTALPFVRVVYALQGGRISPHETASIDLNGEQITIAYGRPYLKSRQFGKDIAPFGEVWRLGADEATKLTVPTRTNLQGGLSLPAGSYSLWAIPGETKWTMIVNKQADVWGTNYDKSQDLGRFDLPVQKAPMTEQFTIQLQKQGPNRAKASFTWGTEQVSTVLTLAS